MAIRDLDSVIRDRYFFTWQEVIGDDLRIISKDMSGYVRNRREALTLAEFKSLWLRSSDDPLAVAWRDGGGSAIQLPLW